MFRDHTVQTMEEHSATASSTPPPELCGIHDKPFEVQVSNSCF
jgi:hypothetical protein